VGGTVPVPPTGVVLPTDQDGEAVEEPGEAEREEGVQGALRDYVRQAQELPPGGTRGYLPGGRTAIWLGRQSMRLMTAWPLRRLIAGIFQKADAITLGDYSPAGDEVGGEVADVADPYDHGVPGRSVGVAAGRPVPQLRD
jgi:hypothetical protein